MEILDAFLNSPLSVTWGVLLVLPILLAADSPFRSVRLAAAVAFPFAAVLEFAFLSLTPTWPALGSFVLASGCALLAVPGREWPFLSAWFIASVGYVLAFLGIGAVLPGGDWALAVFIVSIVILIFALVIAAIHRRNLIALCSLVIVGVWSFGLVSPLLLGTGTMPLPERVTSGARITMAILDNGFALDPAWGRVEPGYNASLPGQPIEADKGRSHGTPILTLAVRLADAIAARGGPDIGIVPIQIAAPGAVTSDWGALLRAKQYLDTRPDVRVISISYSSSALPSERNGLETLFDQFTANGALLVGSAGNQGRDYPNAPGGLPGALSVMAFDGSGGRYAWSNVGDLGVTVGDVGGPLFAGCPVCFTGAPTGQLVNGMTSVPSGTSSATPQAAVLAAAWLAQHQGESAASAKAALIAAAGAEKWLTAVGLFDCGT